MFEMFSHGGKVFGSGPVETEFTDYWPRVSLLNSTVAPDGSKWTPDTFKTMKVSIQGSALM